MFPTDTALLRHPAARHTPQSRAERLARLQAAGGNPATAVATRPIRVVLVWSKLLARRQVCVNSPV